MARRTAEQKEQDRIFIANLLLRYPHLRTWEIRKKLNSERSYRVTQENVEADIQAIRNRLDLSSDTVDVYRASELDQINARQSFCWAVFEGDIDSTSDTFEFMSIKMPKRRVETIVKTFEWTMDDNGNMKPTPVASRSSIEMLRGNAEWLKNCLAECSRARRELLGLDAPKKAELAMTEIKPELPEHLQAIIKSEYG